MSKSDFMNELQGWHLTLRTSKIICTSKICWLKALDKAKADQIANNLSSFQQNSYALEIFTRCSQLSMCTATAFVLVCFILYSKYFNFVFCDIFVNSKIILFRYHLFICVHSFSFVCIYLFVNSYSCALYWICGREY